VLFILWINGFKIFRKGYKSLMRIAEIALIPKKATGATFEQINNQ
jgi:hypothetical protein